MTVLATSFFILFGCNQKRTANFGSYTNLQISWQANHETGVNAAGGGYNVYYSADSTAALSAQNMVNVPYASGAAAPTSASLTSLPPGTYYITVVAYSASNGGTTSPASTPIKLAVP